MFLHDYLMPTPTLTRDERNHRERVGSTIRDYREARGYRPDEFANAVGISRSYLSNIEAGRKPLTKVLLAKMATALNVRQMSIVHPGYWEDAA